jgi:hypothetical protein
MIQVGCGLAHIPVGDFVRHALLPVLVPVVPAALLATGTQTVVPATSWPVLIAEAVVAAAVYAFVSLALLASPRDIRRLAQTGFRRLAGTEARVTGFAGRAPSPRAEEVDVEVAR